MFVAKNPSYFLYGGFFLMNMVEKWYHRVVIRLRKLFGLKLHSNFLKIKADFTIEVQGVLWQKAHEKQGCCCVFFWIFLDLYKEKCCKNTDDMLFVNRVLVFFGAKEGLCLLPKIKRNWDRRTVSLFVKQQCFISKKMKCI